MLAGMTVEENLLVAAPPAALPARRIAGLFDRFPILRTRATSPPVRCRAANSRCSRSLARWRSAAALLLDEPSMGLAPKLVDAISRSSPTNTHAVHHPAGRAERAACAPIADMRTSWTAAGSSSKEAGEYRPPGRRCRYCAERRGGIGGTRRIAVDN